MASKQYGKRVAFLLAMGILSQSLAVPVFADAPLIKTMDELRATAYSAMVNRTTDFDIHMRGYTKTIFADIWSNVQRAYEGDAYLLLNMDAIRYEAKVLGDDISVTFHAKYRTTAEQEAYITKNIDAILSTLLKDKTKAYDKLTAIHDHVLQKVAYDETLKRRTAYDALKDGKAVCQGYVLLFYRMLQRADIPVRIVVGTLKKDQHAWCLVQLDGQWYHVDPTNDDSVGKTVFFLKSDKDMKAAEFAWIAANYPAAPKSYELPKPKPDPKVLQEATTAVLAAETAPAALKKDLALKATLLLKKLPECIERTKLALRLKKLV